MEPSSFSQRSLKSVGMFTQSAYNFAKPFVMRAAELTSKKATDAGYAIIDKATDVGDVIIENAPIALEHLSEGISYAKDKAVEYAPNNLRATYWLAQTHPKTVFVISAMILGAGFMLGNLFRKSIDKSEIDALDRAYDKLLQRVKPKT